MGLVDLLGGVVAAGGNVIEVPTLAVLSLTRIELRQVAAPYMVVELTANDALHWQFLRPVRITLDYSHCPLESVQRGPLSVWLVDTETGAMLQNMDAVDDRANRTITFQTDHFSGYAIAN